MSPRPAPLTKGEQPAVYKDSGGDRQVIGNGGTLLADLGSVLACGFGLGALSSPTTEVVTEQFGHSHRTTITLKNFLLPTVDVGGAEGYGSAPLYVFPRGNIEVLGTTTNLTLVAAAGIGATAAVVTAVGSVAAAADATLTGTEADLVPSFASTLTASAGVMKGLGQTDRRFDNTTTTNSAQLTARLNAAIPDAGSTANSTITCNGTVQFTWINHGDN